MDRDLSGKLHPGIIPFMLPPGPLPGDRNTRCGLGMIVPVSAAAGVETVLVHNLGRKVTTMQVISNGPNGSLYPPRVKRTAATNTPNGQSIIAEADLVGAFIFVW